MKSVSFERAIFLSWYCSVGDCTFCYMSTQKNLIKEPKKAKRSYESIFSEAIITKACGWEVEFLSGGYDSYSFDEIVFITKTISEISGKKQWLNIGVLSKSELKKISPYIQGFTGAVECVNEKVRKQVCPSKPLEPIIKTYKYCDEIGIKKGMTQIIGLGETIDDFKYLKKFIEENKIDRITFYALNPQKGTCFEKSPDITYYSEWIKLTRQSFPNINIIAGAWHDKTNYFSKLITSGADAITKFPSLKMFGTVKAKEIEQEVKNAGKTFFGTLSVMPKLDWNKEIEKLSLQVALEKRLKKKILEYLKKMEKNISRKLNKLETLLNKQYKTILMTLKLYNTLSRKKEIFHPIKEGVVKLYSCGPTVYHYAHIGNLRTYVFNDILRRTLLYNGYKLNHVMNITDVGHLTSDGDSGEDKMLKGAKREKKTVYEIAEYYTQAFLSDIKKLNIQTPEHIPKATENIKEMIEIIKKIEKNGYAYVSGGNVYFDTSKFKNYSKLAKLNLDEMEKGARVDEDKNKKNRNDFVLWFTKSKFDEQEMKWDSPWGKGYPGWHIECSAMSSKYLGEQFDIHTGGIDHIPVHHTNEIAQSEAAFDVHPWVKYWMHGEFLVIDTGKMAKSSGDFLRLQTLIDKGYEPIVYRYFCLTAHYKQQLKFSYEGMDSAKNAYNNLKSKIIELKKSINEDEESNKKKITELKYDFLSYINDDLNMPKAMSLVYLLLKEEKISKKEKYDLLLEFDKILGLGFESMKEDNFEIDSEIEEMIKKRDLAKKQKDFVTSDKIRNELKEKGIILEDTKDGTKWKKA